MKKSKTKLLFTLLIIVCLFIYKSSIIFAYTDPLLIVNYGKVRISSGAFGDQDYQEEWITSENRELELNSETEYDHQYSKEQPWWSMAHSKSQGVLQAGSKDGENSAYMVQCIYSRSGSDGVNPPHGFANSVVRGSFTFKTNGYPAKLEVLAKYNTGCSSTGEHCVGNYAFEGFSLEIDGPERGTTLDFSQCQEGCGQNLQTQTETFLVNDGDKFDFKGKLRGSTTNSGVLNGCVQVLFKAMPMQPPKAKLVSAKMVSPTELGIGAEVEFPIDFPSQTRFLKFFVKDEGRVYPKTINVTELIEPGELKSIGLINNINSDLDYKTPLRIDLKELGIPRFTDNTSLILGAAASYWDNNTLVKPISSREIKILLPVLFVHGYDGPGRFTNLFGNAIENKQKDTLFKYLSKHIEDYDFTTGYDSSSWFQDLTSPRYKTLWYKTWPSRDPDWNLCRWFRTWMSEVFTSTRAKKVNIVAHSLGGLVSRHFVTECGGSTDVSKVIMVGTPNKGTAKTFKDTNGWDLPSVKNILKDSPLGQWGIPNINQGYQALFKAELIEKRNKKEKPEYELTPLTPTIENNFSFKNPPPGVNYYSIYTTIKDTPARYIVNTVCPRSQKNCLDSEVWYKIDNDLTRKLEGKIGSYAGGDGVVTVESAKLNPGERIQNIEVDKNISHINLLYDNDILEKIYMVLRKNVE